MTTAQKSLWLKGVSAVLALALPAAAQVTVVNNASFAPRFPVAPGGIAAAFGSFAGVGQATASTIPLPGNLNNVRLFVNNVEAPLFFTSSGQINFQVPRNTPFGKVPVRVTGGTAEVAGTMDVFDYSPGIIKADAGDTSQFPLGLVINQNNSVNSQNARAKRGEVIQIWTTGLGPVNGTVADGAAAPENNRTTAEPEVYVSVDKAVIQFSGLQSQFVGIYQVNAVVPDKTYISGQVPLQLVMNGVESNVVSIWVE